MWRRLFLPLLVVAQTVSWAQDKSSPAPVPQNSSKATVYVYRYKQFVGAALAPSVYCDDVQLARMENGRYFANREMVFQARRGLLRLAVGAWRFRRGRGCRCPRG